MRDSKKLAPERRTLLAQKIEKIATSIIVLRVQPCQIDDCREMGINLDKIEAMKMAQIIDMCNGSKFFVDSLQQNPKKFENLIMSYLQKKGEVELVVKNYLDESVPIVSAASIIAKVERDVAIAELKKRVNFDFGVGYPSDARTISFVKKLIKETKGGLPTFVRKSWVTTQLLQEQVWQKKIKDFFVKNE